MVEPWLGGALGCMTQFAIDLRLPRRVGSPRCLPRAEIAGPATPGGPPFNDCRFRGRNDEIAFPIRGSYPAGAESNGGGERIV